MFGKTLRSQRKYRDIKLVTAKNRHYLVLEPNYYTTKIFMKNLLAIEMKTTQITMNELVYLDLLILDLSKTVIYDFWYDYIKPKYGERAILR